MRLNLSVDPCPYLGIVQGTSPGCRLAHECPVHVEFGSFGGPHQGERSSHQCSLVSMAMTTTKPMSAMNATMPAVSQMRNLLVTVAPYAEVSSRGRPHARHGSSRPSTGSGGSRGERWVGAARSALAGLSRALLQRLANGGVSVAVPATQEQKTPCRGL